MSEPRVCISIAEESLDAVDRLLRDFTDESTIIECRLDRLKVIPPIEELGALSKLGRLIFTLRPMEQGGFGKQDRLERLFFWESIARGIDTFNASTMFDNEHDILPESRLPRNRVIGSIHSFQGDLPNKRSLISEIAVHAETVKLSWMVETTETALEVFSLLDHASSLGVRLIPISMGEAGKISRVLAVGHGACFSYCCLDGKLVAPGQISATEMRSSYRIETIAHSTEVYGLIAGDTSYSLSPLIHNRIFTESSCDAVFVPFQTRDVSSLIGRLLSDEFPFRTGGFAVTNPFKKIVMDVCDEVDPLAISVGAVNTIKCLGDRTVGYNTDVAGFIGPLRRKLRDLAGSNVAVIGTGGASRAAIVALTQAGCAVTVFGRDANGLDALNHEFQIETAPLTEEPMRGFRIIVNATPLGTLGALADETVLESRQFEDAELAYDLVYNPHETLFMKEAKRAGCKVLGGLEMLVDQAIEQQRIWNGPPCDRDALLAIVAKKLSSE
jgi:3-dehydroquinate dehydratase/shikimate dehydrogenase